MPEVTVGDVTIHYERSGRGRPLVFLHGLGSSSADWERQVKVFSDTYDVIVPDLRGHGQTTKPPGPYTISQFAEDIATFLDELDPGPVRLVGISLGGMAGFQMVADRPDLVSRFVAVNALPAFEVEKLSYKVQLVLRRVFTRLFSMERIGAMLAKRLFPDPDLARERETMVRRWALNDKKAYSATLRAILDWRGVARDMESTMVPIRLISSDLDYVAPEEKQPYVDRMPTAEMVIMYDAHHGVPMERPERFNAVLTKMLS